MRDLGAALIATSESYLPFEWNAALLKLPCLYMMKLQPNSAIQRRATFSPESGNLPGGRGGDVWTGVYTQRKYNFKLLSGSLSSWREMAIIQHHPIVHHSLNITSTYHFPQPRQFRRGCRLYTAFKFTEKP
ncbi:hypothetical protein EJ06DRAFT_256124 [Trichodelitschia bisporula]|uniref:Uncharacterized protein n=1 Tax=Trichodelitschia bisporula TaxID=703511 RepID=A0A6G1HJ17_9PEZI|nr:hypothetical protein EJ06DRAFT_256124 [Trichodelitschia bisporula]